uniref:RdRp n=1 Tax=Avocado citrivirus 1 TaxID=2794431 RepID=A0A7T5QZ94_9VIRU|nr:RdRp [Avocado citrivirus 1]
MAFLNSKTALECFIGNLEKTEQKLIYKPGSDYIIENSKFRSKHFGFALGNKEKMLLTSKGIELYPCAFVPHSHPISKTIENHFLFDVLPGLIVDKKFLFISIKSKKVRAFIRHANRGNDISFLNRLVDAKDTFRYPECNDVQCGEPSSTGRVSLFSNNFLKRVKESSTNIFIHDEVHHWSKLEMFNFISSTRFSNMLFTVVYPVELLNNIGCSQNPRVYTFETKGDKLLFFPDGVQNEGYEQRLNLAWLFKASKLNVDGVIYTVKRIKTVFSHHLFSISRGDYHTDTVRCFSDFDTIDLSILHRNRFRNYCHVPIKHEMLFKIYTYLLCLKKPDIESGIAKLRQLMGDECDLKVVLFFEKFVERVLNHGKKKGLFGQSLFEKITEELVKKIPDLFLKHTSTWKQLNLFEFILNSGPLSIKVECGEVTRSTIESLGFDSFDLDLLNFNDPLSFFDTSENFNSEYRVDDTIIDSVNLRKHGWSKKTDSIFKANMFDLLSIDVKRWKEITPKKKVNKNINYSICYPNFDSSDIEKVHSNFIKFLDLEHVVGRDLGHPKGLRVSECLSESLSILVKNGEQINYDIFLDVFSSFSMGLDAAEMLADGTFGSVQCNWFVSKCQLSRNITKVMESEIRVEEIDDDQEDADSGTDTSKDDKEEEGKRGDQGEETPIESEGPSEEMATSDPVVAFKSDDEGEPPSHKDTNNGGCFAFEGITLQDHKGPVSEKTELPNMNSFLGDCHLLHGQPIDVPGDGSCFLHALLRCFDSLPFKNALELRLAFSDHLLNSGKAEYGMLVRNPAGHFGFEWIKDIAEWLQIELVLHSAGSVYVLGVRGGLAGHHIDHSFEHFRVLETLSIEDSVFKSPLDGIIELKVSYKTELPSVETVVEGAKCTKFKGRKAFFFSRDRTIDYGHNGVKYQWNQWPEHFDQLLESFEWPVGGFNAALYQIYQPHASIGFHKDNESVYDNDDIITVNVRGDALFKISSDAKDCEFLLSGPGAFVMKGGFQKKHRHSVQVQEYERASITFRKHKRTMAGRKIESFDFESADSMKNLKKKCFFKAVADSLDVPVNQVFKAVTAVDRSFWMEWIQSESGTTISDVQKACQDLQMTLEIHSECGAEVFDCGSKLRAAIKEEPKGHYQVARRMKNVPRSLVSPKAMGGNLKLKMDSIRGLEGVSSIMYVAEQDRAVTLMNSLLNRTTGVNTSEILSEGKKVFNNLASFMEDKGDYGFEVLSLSGFAGSGKSRGIQKILSQSKGSNFTVVSPRNNLKKDWIDKLALNEKDGYKVCTFETFLRREKRKLELVIIDELTLFPNGYLDLVLFQLEESGSKAEIVLIFDPLQARYHASTDYEILKQPHDVDKLTSDREINYIYGSFRLDASFYSKIFEDLPMFSGGEQVNDTDDSMWVFPSIFDVRIISEDKGCRCDCLLVESQLEKSQFCETLQSMTFGEAQGLTFDHVCIVLSESSAQSDDFRWLVALTRARKRISFVCTHLGGLDGFKMAVKGSIPKRVVNKQKITWRLLSLLVRCTFNRIPIKACGSDEVDREERLQGDPFLKPFIFLGMRVEVEEPEPQKVEVEELLMPTHMFITEANFSEAYNFDLIRAKESREYREDMEVTDQFVDNFNVWGPRSYARTSGPMRYKAIYPKHAHKDDLTFWMAVKKRLRFADEITNRGKLERAQLIGNLLYTNFKQKLKLNFSHDQQLLDQSRNEFEVKKLSKSKEIIANNSNRSEVDWALNDVFLFMKSQLCTKFEKQYVDAKAGQTLACFNHLILCEFAPWCRYMEHMIRRQLPESVYIHSNKNFDELNEWVKKFFCNDICVESDYESFDASQDEYILAFEVALMTDMGIPQQVIDGYVDIKCKLSCRLGHFAIMRFTGEFSTFLFNTLANMAFTFARYDWKDDTPVAFAGDDMCALRNMPLRHDMDLIFEKISLKAKVDRTENPMFCGWRLSKYGIVKEPELVYNRFQVAIEDGKLLECLDNYAIEVSYAYSLSERLYEVLKSEKQIQYHQATVRLIVRCLDKVKHSVRNLYSEQIGERGA